MIKLITVLLLGLVLSACTGNSEVRPEINGTGENLLHAGLSAYNRDDYPAAIQKFNAALAFYQSIDDIKGVQLSRFNLLEANIALSDFAAAEEQITLLKRQQLTGSLDGTFTNKLALLEVKLLFQEQRYQEALAAIEPLLSQSQQRDVMADQQLELLAMAARLEALVYAGSKQQWLDQFRSALAQAGESRQPKFKIIAKRIDAVVAEQKQQYPEALKLLNEALNFYKTLGERRAIASCLEEMADVELAQRHKPQAVEYLNRALAIRVWLKDQHNIDKIRQKILLAKRQS